MTQLRGPTQTYQNMKRELEAAATALHRIASSNQAKRILAKPGKLTEPMLASMRAKVMTEEEIDRLCLDTFEAICTVLPRDGQPESEG